MKILVTGYRGFIGQNLVHALTEQHELILFEWGDEFPDFRDLDWCIHLGAISSTAETDVEKVMRQNYDFSCKILDACQQHGVNLQYASSASVYGLNQDFRESAAKNPQSPYAWSKYLFDRCVENNVFSNIRVQGFRYFNVYGPGEDHKDQPSPHTAFSRQAQTTGVIKLFENSDRYLRDFVPVETVIDYHQRFFSVKESGIWNIGTGQPESFESVARKIAEKYQARIEYIPMPVHLINQYQEYTCADMTKTRKTLFDL